MTNGVLQVAVDAKHHTDGWLDNARDLRDWTADHRPSILAGAAGVVAFLWVGRSPLVAGGLVVALTVIGLWLWRDALHSGDLRRGQLRRMFGLVLLPPALLTFFALGGLWLPLISLLAVGLIGGVLWMLSPEPEPEQWWGENSLRGAFVAAGVLRPDTTHVLSRIGPPTTHDQGESVALKLPPGMNAGNLDRERLASALDIPADRLLIDHPAGHPPSAVRLTVRTPDDRPRGTTLSPVGDATATRWWEPCRIGAERHKGRPAFLGTHEENSLIAGMPGKGKTSTARIVLAHYLLDPTSRLFILDGKGSRKDYGNVRPLTEAFVSGAQEDAAQQFLLMLRTVLGIVRERNDTHEQGIPDHWPGVLLLLEELQEVRAAAEDKALLADIDTHLGRVIRMGRAVGVKVLISTQRPSVEDVPAGVRNLVSQRLALPMRNPEDAKLVLGTSPKDVPMPKDRGEGLLATPTGVQEVRLDHLTQEAWLAVCERATAIRQRPTPQVVLIKPAAPVTLRSEVLRALSGGPLTAAVLYEQMAPQARPVNIVALGKALAALPGVEGRRTTQGRVWTLAAPVAPDTDPTRMWGADPDLSVNGAAATNHTHLTRASVGGTR